MQWDKVSLTCFFASYVVALVLEVVQFFTRTSALRWGAMGFSVAGAIAQTIYLVVRSQQSDLPPLLGSTHDWLLVLAWLTVVVLLGIQFWDRQIALGIFLLPLVLALVATARFARAIPNPRLGSLRDWSMVHASFWVFGMGGVLLALIVSLMYLVQHRRLRDKQLELPGMHLLSLERLGHLNRWLILVSVPFLTLGMASGLWMSYLAKGTAHPVNLASADFVAIALMWLMMAVLCGWLLSSRQPAGKLVAWRTLWACGFLIGVLLLMKVLSQDGIHAG
jgi:hypothetical protein